MSIHLGLVGCGKMGTAMAQSWIKNNAVRQLTLIDPVPQDSMMNIPTDIELSHHQAIEQSDLNAADIVILAVKPQIMDDICQTLKPYLNDQTTIVSIAAGRTIESFEHVFERQDLGIVRVMPNTPAAIGKGISVMVANTHVSQDRFEIVRNLIEVTGDVIAIENENLMDAVTAVSGSGPAYIFHLIEAMTAAGIEAGLPEDLSEKLARQTVIGSGYLAEAQASTSASTLRENVTSPGGTTAAALNVLMNDKALEKLMTQAILAAKKRGQELSGK